ncbi:gluconate 2-dehydrogenase subunit 3 family protein [Luteibacter aegosomatissinici]|uniref:gluconate 2-dehydrogenase subunit 3 family protein n=1 Tax=Luteibacter aegosomatissinici TaxID=2911539 RepID=UPI001FF7EEA7|nr:gluconate 2-dehydrogenase subunit 3 family protein [Luteibacter aegosomatissinici]UPG96622.1 gluconate 2-dehydrogenase subunit 3 family protein [Luteibacter aegosomatissinici]
MSEKDPSPDALQSRRRILMGLSLAPLAAALPGVHAADKAAPGAGGSSFAGADDPRRYTPSFFKDTEWAFIQAACDRLIPADDTGPGAVESGVPAFLDKHMQTPYAAGAIWYMQGPFLEAPAEFGYQGKLTLRDIIRVGIDAMDAHCRKTYAGKTFAQLDTAMQEDLLTQAESGKLKLEGISSKLFFSNFLNEVKNGYFADPKYGGNRNMGAWKMIGYPGMRADYIDWIGVRDKAYPLPPVDLSGKRG